MVLDGLLVYQPGSQELAEPDAYNPHLRNTLS
jgi:hypothetical protein